MVCRLRNCCIGTHAVMGGEQPAYYFLCIAMPTLIFLSKIHLKLFGAISYVFAFLCVCFLRELIV